MLTRAKIAPRHRNAGRPLDKSAPAFLQWLRGRACVLASLPGHECEGKIEAAHVDHAGGKGIGTKVADCHAIPLCSGAHRAQHSAGWRTFEMRHGINAVALAADFWRAWPGRVAWKRKQEDRA
jgi:hypothetical protein